MIILARRPLLLICASFSFGASASLAQTPAPELEAKGMAAFPEIIQTLVVERDLSERATEKTILDVHPNSIPVALERGIVQMLRGAALLKDNQRKQAVDELEASLTLLPKDSQLTPVAEMLLVEAKIPSLKPLEALARIKNLTKKYPSMVEWRSERYVLMLDILMAAKSDAVLLKTWAEYESKVRPAQRSEDIGQKVATYLDKRAKTPSKELISVLESMAALYPYNAVSRWAFQRLQSFSCGASAVKARYIPSTWLLSRLAGNSVLDAGLRSYVIEAIKSPVRSGSGEIKALDASERVAFLIQARLVDDAQELAVAEFSETLPAKTPKEITRRSKAMFQLGQVHVRQNNWLAAAAIFSLYIEEFSDKFENRAAHELLADSLVRLKQYRSAAQMYARLGASPSSDSILRWHHFWNTYLAGDYKEALGLLDRPGYVPSRDRGIEGGLDYWRGRILERMDQKPPAEDSFKRILAVNGDSYYAILTQANRPMLREARQNTPPAFHDGALDIRDELAGKDGFAAKILDNGPNPSQVELDVGDRLDISISRLLQKWGQYKTARRLLRTTAWSRVVARKMFPEIADLAFALGDFGFGLKVAALPDSPFKQVPSATIDLREHMAKHNVDWRLMYPMAHERLAVKYSDAAGIDPYLLLSIMRAESVYDPDARSGVGAQGLMQIMPFTAIRIARLMGDDQFELNRLHMPEVNIGYGAYYLRKLLDYYDGNMLLAVAGYNAGPTHVDRWVGAYSHLGMDEFVESIPFKETRRYVKSVLRNLNQYLNIYSEKPALIKLPPIPDKKSEMELF